MGQSQHENALIPPLLGWREMAFHVSSEDRFVTISLAGLRESPSQSQLVGFADSVRALAQDHTVLLDYSQERFINRDMVDICWLLGDVATIVTTRENFLRSACINVPNLKVWTVQKQQLPLRFTRVNAELFEAYPEFPTVAAASLFVHEPGRYSAKNIARLIYDRDQLREVTRQLPQRSVEELRVEFLRSVIARRGGNSLLTQYVLDINRDSASVVPYHGHALYPITSDDQVLVARPAVLARSLNAIFRSDLKELEDLLAWPRAQERHFQAYFEKHPQIFRSLGYREIYPQVVLEREDGTSLRPDFLLEPIDSPWCDILDIKLPSMKLLTGRADRRRVSASLTEVAAQLREYRAYFDDQNLANWFESRYKLKCYRPRLKAVIGRRPPTMATYEERRALTAYDDLGVITFDDILRIARERLLI